MLESVLEPAGDCSIEVASYSFPKMSASIYPICSSFLRQYKVPFSSNLYLEDEINKMLGLIYESDFKELTDTNGTVGNSSSSYEQLTQRFSLPKRANAA